MTKPTALVANAADPQQVKRAGRKEKDKAEADRAAWREVVASPAGQRVLWQILTYCGLYTDPTHARGDMTHQNIGRGNVGRFVLDEIVKADDTAYLRMMQGALAEAKRDARESEAFQSTNTEEPNNG